MKNLKRLKVAFALSTLVLLVCSSLSVVYLTHALESNVRAESLRNETQVSLDSLREEMTQEAERRVALIESRMFTLEQRIAHLEREIELFLEQE